VSRLVCTFTVQGLLLGLPVADVQEVLREPEVTPIPGAPAAVRGLVNLRGDIIVATDLRRRLALPARTGDGSAMSLVVRTPDGPAALAVDEVGDVLELVGQAAAPPETLEAHLRDLAVGVHELDDGLLVVLDAARAARTHEEPGAPA
jgi:purine-binding chemotaxis protein CheW